jgi:serine/threonine-protein kinase
MADVKTAGRYQLLEELGRGAMGVVYKAHDPTIGRTVAVKTMRLHEAVTGLSHDELIARFNIETRAAGLLTHANIVVVYDAGEDGGLFYITMEFVQGRSLQALIDLKQVFPLPRVMKLMEQAGSALDFAHQNNVVHRDIKPANLMITGDDVVKITDFGTAKILAKGATTTGAILGTPSYMSPEQVKGKPVDGRSDVFSLGVILYELVTGEKPFPGQNVTTVIYKIVNEEPISPRELDSSIHPGLNYVITKALTKNLDDRYQTCKELVEDLRNYRELGDGPSESATVVMPGRMRPKAVEDEIARLKAATPAAPAAPQTKAPTPVAATPVAATPVARPAPEPPRPAPRPATLPPLTITKPEPEEKKSYAAVWISLLLLIVVGAGGYFIWPSLREAADSGQAALSRPAVPATPPPSAADAQPGQDGAAKAGEPEVEPAATDPESAKVASDVEQRLAAAGLGSKLRIRAKGNEVTLAGTLTPEENRQLRRRLRALPKNLRIVDRIQIAKAGVAAAAGEPEEESRPRTAPGMGEIEVSTGALLGAEVTVKGPKGNTFSGKTPTRFEDLPPGRYEVEINKQGYRTERKILTLQAGRVSPVDITMQAVMGGLLVVSRPAAATVYVNGKPHSEPTPATIRLPAGTYRVDLHMEGFAEATRNVTVQGEDLQKVEFTLPPLTSGAPARPPAATQQPAPAPAQPGPARAAGYGFVEIRSIPPGADVLVRNTNTGQKTPARLPLTPGKYQITVFLRGYQPVQREVEVTEGQVTTLNLPLTRQ